MNYSLPKQKKNTENNEQRAHTALPYQPGARLPRAVSTDHRIRRTYVNRLCPGTRGFSRKNGQSRDDVVKNYQHAFRSSRKVFVVALNVISSEPFWIFIVRTRHSKMSLSVSLFWPVALFIKFAVCLLVCILGNVMWWITVGCCSVSVTWTFRLICPIGLKKDGDWLPPLLID